MYTFALHFLYTLYVMSQKHAKFVETGVELLHGAELARDAL